MGKSLAHFYRPRSEGDNVLNSVRPSVHPSVRLDQGHLDVRLSVYNQWAYADNCADAVDWLLISIIFWWRSLLEDLLQRLYTKTRRKMCKAFARDCIS